jgi:hypothetical protein
VAICLDVVRGSFSISVLLEFYGRGRAWLLAVYDPNTPAYRGISGRSCSPFTGFAPLSGVWERIST